MKFNTAKMLVKGFLFAGLALCVVALIVNRSTPGFGMMLTYGGIACVIICLFFVFTSLKCPYCGKRIIKDCLVVKTCPHCHRNLSTGIKSKGKSVKR